MTKQSDIKKLAEQMAGSMKSFDDIKDFQKQLMQSFIDTALEAEMEDHLGYPKHEKADKPNKRNGHTKKTVRSDTGDLEISTPRDRDGAFEPALVRKHQTRISGLDDKIIFFYAKGQTTTEIVESIKELYDVDISSSLVSRVTDNILDDITAWQNRPLSSVYPIVYLDCIVVKSWRNNWEGLTVFFEYPKDIRKAIYTTNAIESLNSVIRTAVNKRKVFPSDQAAFKVVYLATQQASKKWSMPIRNWTSALNRFMIMVDDRISKHLIEMAVTQNSGWSH